MIAKLSTAVCLAGAAVGIWLYCYHPQRCNIGKKALVVSSERAISSDDGTEVVIRARDNVTRATRMLRHCQGDIDLLMLRAANLRLLSRFDEAIADYRAALAVEERPELYLELGTLEIEVGRRADAVEHLARCVRFYPFHISAIGDPGIRAEVEALVFK